MKNSGSETQSQILVVCGVSGSGKSTIGKHLADYLGWHFIEADDFHSTENVAKMRRGQALNDNDRAPWLQQLQEEIKKHLDRQTSAVVACSALQKKYRERLCLDPKRVHFVFLIGDIHLLKSRLINRQDHFMNPCLLPSQLDALEVSEQDLVINIDQPVQQIVVSIIDKMTSNQQPSNNTP